MVDHPKPEKTVKARKLLMRTSRPKRTNAYTQPEWRKLVRAVRKRSKGVCEAHIRCNGDPVSGDPHHVLYGPQKGKKRVLVPIEQLVDCCRACHLYFHGRAA